jgi:hypothetical protein
LLKVEEGSHLDQSVTKNRLFFRGSFYIWHRAHILFCTGPPKRGDRHVMFLHRQSCYYHADDFQMTTAVVWATWFLFLIENVYLDAFRGHDTALARLQDYMGTAFLLARETMNRNAELQPSALLLSYYNSFF